MASPSRFLASFRGAALPSTRVLQASIRTPSTVSHSVSLSTNSKTTTDQYPDDKHSTSKVKKGDDLDIQSSNAKAGMDSAKNNSSGGNATEGSDSAGGVAKAKREHPEAPDPAIGMQDERGGRGG
ncbi:hypothetical protein K458DRAFT_416050 [Lentithecium fluviatile CBS 122367]|uniref:Uncharacterized protein n=1 Tax=Lentithecium fluviatile CBS 122367 TaxID=1168545 RepID=A0A6G1J957_9PLEO|nr:hypothetical protein K458DRAFT_416050 [Lentithecium fluviatile CBS 122367]